MTELGRQAAFAEPLRAALAAERCKSAQPVAAVVGFARSTVIGWWQAFRESGEVAPQTTPTPGCLSVLSEQQLRRLSMVVVDDDPRHLQFEFELWT
ncbi:MAG: hypothetical protein M0T72_06860 [Candidatus Dormibacteraeota bacterium]|nr:hypothetical protein [Candidatus Dormibacteraeota bacterium]